MSAFPHPQTGTLGVPPVAAVSESAISHAVRQVPTALPQESVEAVRHRLADKTFDYAGAVFVLDEADRLLGIIPMAELLAAAGNRRVADIARQPVPSVPPDMDQEQTASLALMHGLAVVPVADEGGRLLGVVPPEALLAILRHEHIEDLHRLAGIARENGRARAAIEAPPLTRVRHRLPWLLVGLFGSVIATMVMARFEATLQANVAIAFFVPGIVYLADAIGTQTEAIAVRGLSLSRAPFSRLVAGEARTGFFIGLVLALLTFPGVWVISQNAALAAAVSVALLAAGAAATTVGLMFPWILSRLGKDPALGSGPIGTIVQDVLSLLIYFATVRLLGF